MSSHITTRTAAVILVVAAAMLVLGLQSAPDQSPDPGEQVFQEVCSTCHSMEPPAKLAPPMLMIANHYVTADLDDPWAAMRAWLDGPSVERSALPAHAIERFGLMPPLSLSAEDADAVVAFIRAKAGAGEEGCSMMEGMMADSTAAGGMQHRHGQSDSTRTGGMMGAGGTMGTCPGMNADSTAAGGMQHRHRMNH